MDVDAVKANTAAKETTNTTDPKFIEVSSLTVRS